MNSIKFTDAMGDTIAFEPVRNATGDLILIGHKNEKTDGQIVQILLEPAQIQALGEFLDAHQDTLPTPARPKSYIERYDS